MLSTNSPNSPGDLDPVSDYINRVFLDGDGTDVWISVIGTDKDGFGGSADGDDVVTLKNHMPGGGGSIDDIQATLEVLDGLYGLEQDTYDVPTLEAIAAAQGGSFLGVVVMTGSGEDTIDASGLKYHGNTTLDAGADDDTITGGAKDDTILGGEGDDLIKEADRFDNLENAGGPGYDTVETAAPTGGLGISVTSDNIEHFTGTSESDFVDFSGNPDSVTVIGGAGDDEIRGGSGDDMLFGDAGEDSISGGAGADTIDGGTEDDILNGDAGDDTITGGDGDDTIDGGADHDDIFGGSGNDDIVGDTGNDYIEGDDGDDDIEGNEGNDTLLGEDGDDTLDGGDGADDVLGGEGSDTLIGLVDGDADYYDGGETGSNVDLLTFKDDGGVLVNLERGFTNDGDTIAGSPLAGSGDEDHEIYTNSSIENVTGSMTESNTLIGDAEPNVLIGGNEADVISGRDGNDSIVGGSGPDTLRGEGGDDTIMGNGGADLIEGDGDFDWDGDGDFADEPAGAQTNGSDTIYGGDENDTIYTNSKNLNIGVAPDTVYGEGGDDTVTGDGGEDNVMGGSGNDIILGLAGRDELHGNSGNDTITGGAGRDILVGGDDVDVLNIEAINGASLGGGILPDIAVVTGSGADTINVHGVGGPLTTAEEAAASIELDDDVLGPVGGGPDDIFSDYDPSIDNLFFS